MFNYLSSFLYEPEVKKMTNTEKEEVKKMVDNVLLKALERASSYKSSDKEDSDDLIDFNPTDQERIDSVDTSVDTNDTSVDTNDTSIDTNDTSIDTSVDTSEEMKQIEEFEEAPILDDNIEKPLLDLSSLEKLINKEKSELIEETKEKEETDLLELEDVNVLSSSVSSLSSSFITEPKTIFFNTIETQTEKQTEKEENENSDFEFDNENEEEEEENFDEEFIDDFSLLRSISRDVTTLIRRNAAAFFTCSVIAFNAFVFAFLMF